MCSWGELDPCEVWDEVPRRARKPHDCRGCGAVIAPGDAYLSHFNIFEGEATREACCFACWWTRELFVSEHGQYFVPSSLLETLRECIAQSWPPGETLEERATWKRQEHWRPVLAGVLNRYRQSPVLKRIRARRRAEQEGTVTA